MRWVGYEIIRQVGSYVNHRVLPIKNHEVDDKFGELSTKLLAKEAATALIGITHEMFFMKLIINLVDWLQSCCPKR